MEEKIIKIDYADWYDAAMGEETIPQSEKDVIDAIASGQTTMRVARDLIVAQETGNIPKRITRPYKVLLNAAAAYDVSTLVKREKTTVETANGTEYQIPAYVGRLGRPPEEKQEEEPKNADATYGAEVANALSELEEPDEYEPAYVLTKSPAGLDYATRHLENFIPGNIWNRLLDVHGCGGDVTAQAQKLKAAIDEMVVRIVEK